MKKKRWVCPYCGEEFSVQQKYAGHIFKEKLKRGEIKKEEKKEVLQAPTVTVQKIEKEGECKEKLERMENELREIKKKLELIEDLINRAISILLQPAG
jgi:polyhydroxyalkanoate synthesis regulator phasin